MIKDKQTNFYFKIEYSFSNDGKDLKEIIEELFLLNIKEFNL